MKTLHLMRHAKSSWKNQRLADRDRGLNKRGQRDAPRMGEALSGIISPQPVAVSTATRAQLTLEGLGDAWPALESLQHRSVEDLYTFSSADLCDWLAAQDDDLTQLFIIGHNPAFTELINYLVGDWCLDNLPTAGYARLSLSIDQWRDILQGCGVLEQCLFPRQLAGH